MVGWRDACRRAGEPNEPLTVGRWTSRARAGEVAVQVHACGVCHSDLGAVNGTFPMPLPVVLGHEAAGGSRRSAPGSPGCGRRPRGPHAVAVVRPLLLVRARRARHLRRPHRPVHRYLPGRLHPAVPRRPDRLPGAQRGGVRRDRDHPGGGAIKIDEDVPSRSPAWSGRSRPASAVLNTAKVPGGATVLVMGLGGVGLSVVQGARLAASRVIAVDPGRAAGDRPAPRRHRRARPDRPRTWWPPPWTSPASWVWTTPSRPPAGALATACVNATRPGGCGGPLVGARPRRNLELGPAVFRVVGEEAARLHPRGARTLPGTLPRYLDLWRAGRLDLEALITGTRPSTRSTRPSPTSPPAPGVRTVLTL